MKQQGDKDLRDLLRALLTSPFHPVCQDTDIGGREESRLIDIDGKRIVGDRLSGDIPDQIDKAVQQVVFLQGHQEFPVFVICPVMADDRLPEQ